METGSLTLPTLMPSLGPELEEKIRRDWDTFESMELMLVQAGFQPEEPPKVRKPEITAELLHSADSRRYSEVYNALRSWNNYAINCLGRYEAKLIEIINEQKDIEREYRKLVMQQNRDNNSKKLTVQQLDDLIKDIPRYHHLLIEEQKYTQLKVLMQSYVEALGKDMALVSRNIEVRRQDAFSTVSTGTRYKPGPGNLYR